MAIFRPRPRTMIGAGVATTVVASLALLAPAAADVSNAAVPDITIDSESVETPTAQYDYVGMSATWDLSDADPEVGDELTLELPPEFNLDVYNFPLVIDEDTTLGTCVTTPMSGETMASLVCTLENRDYLEEHDNIWATADASMQAWQQTSEETVLFGTHRGMVEVPLPGGIGTPGHEPKPEAVAKDGWIGSNRAEAYWRVFIPGSLVAGADPVTVVDELPEGLSYQQDSVRVTSVPDTADGWDAFQAGHDEPVDADAVEVSTAGNELTVEINGFDPSRLYVVRFTTVIDDPSAHSVGDIFTNTVHVEDHRSTTTAELLSRGSGAAGGDQTPPEPTEPIEPTEPTEPAEPTEPTEPSEPSNPTETAEPSEPGTPDATESETAGETTPPASPSDTESSTDEPAGSASDNGDAHENSADNTEDKAESSNEPSLAATGSSGIIISVVGALALLMLGLALLTRSRSRQH